MICTCNANDDQQICVWDGNVPSQIVGEDRLLERIC